MFKTLLPFLATALVMTAQIATAKPVPENAPTAAECVAPTTQKRMNDCAYEDFLAATASYAESNKFVSNQLSGQQRDLFRRSQKAWIGFSAAACDFESSAVKGGSAQGMVKWQCMARMSRARVVELKAMGNCTEGDLGCVRFKR